MHVAAILLLFRQSCLQFASLQ